MSSILDPIRPGPTLIPGEPRYEGLAEEFASAEFAALISNQLQQEHRFQLIHPVANFLPMMSEEDRPSFRASLAKRQNHPVLFHMGMLADGRNRARELIELRKPINSVTFEGSTNQLVKYLKAENIERRHLTFPQRVDYAARVARLPLGANQHTMGASREAPSLLPSSGSPADWDFQEDCPAQTVMSQSEAAAEYGVSRATIQRYSVVLDKGTPELQSAVQRGEMAVNDAMSIAELPIEQQREIIAKADPKAVKEVAKKNRQEKTKKTREQWLKAQASPSTMELFTGRKATVLYVDIPREFKVYSEETGIEKSPGVHYRTEAFEALANMRDKILDLANPNCFLAMWGWASSLPDQLDLMAEWGFATSRRFDENGRLLRDRDGTILPPTGEGRYRSHLIWAKRNASGTYHRGTGFWFIDCHELLLVGARGTVRAPEPGTQSLSIFDAPIGEHSAKPEGIRDLLDGYFPDVPKTELFGRVDDVAAFKARWPTWEVMGNEA